VTQSEVDEEPEAKGQYFLTGSQQLEMLATVQESLAGRALLLDLWPMSVGELFNESRGGLLERDGVFTPVEIKLSLRPSRRDLGGIRSFSKTYPRLPLGPRIVIHGGEELFLLDELTVAVPVAHV
jgi:hypothetical protein